MIARAAAGEAIDGAVLIAEHQTAGRGRNGRTWVATPRAQITMSVAVPADAVPTEAWGWLPLAAGVAVVDTVADGAWHGRDVTVGLKWPNDILAGTGGSFGKLAGILAEVAVPARTIVVGIGLNVDLREDELAATDGATSLVALGAEELDRDRLIRKLLSHLGRRVEDWQRASGADEALRADYLARSLTVGSRVRAMLPGGAELLGTAHSVDEQGRLRLTTADGIVPVSAGDIVHLRPVHDDDPSG